MKPYENKDVINDVKCSVENCHFNDHGGNCTAEEIEVSPCSGSGCEGTLCATFIDRDKCQGCF